jgi:peptidoglycan/xylan/chitin deacetylase (PgdA/CDA1 family)
MIKTTIRPIAFYGGYPFLKFVTRRLAGKRCIFILLYHKIGPQAPPLLGETVLPQDFERQIRFLKKRFEIIDLKDLKDSISEANSSKDMAILTSDDGYRDNFLYAFPILKKYDVPLTIFLTTDVIGTKQLLWPDKLAWILYTSDTNFNRQALYRTDLPQEMIHSVEKFFLKDASRRAKILRSISEYLKSHSNEEREDLLGTLTKFCDIKQSPAENFRAMLSWEEVKQMSRDGISFGSHTKSHPTLSKIPLNLARQEIVDSKQVIEEQIQKPVITFAYPYGKRDDISEGVVKLLRDEGFEYACTTEIGYEQFPINNPLFLKRKGVPPSPYLFL